MQTKSFYAIILIVFTTFSTISLAQITSTSVKTDKPGSIALIEHDIISDENINQLVISFGENLNSNLVSIANVEEFNWKISSNVSSEISGVGEKIFDYTFDTPGEYNLVFHHFGKSHINTCEHNEEPIQFRVRVLNEKYDFLLDELVLSNTIVGNVETNGIVLSIPINYSSYDGNLGTVKGLKMISSGVSTSILGEPVNNDFSLKNGKNIVSFNLKGKATPNTYIMFDFYNHENLIDTYYLLNEIK
jgi:hypothetical protein